MIILILFMWPCQCASICLNGLAPTTNDVFVNSFSLDTKADFVNLYLILADLGFYDIGKFLLMLAQSTDRKRERHD